MCVSLFLSKKKRNRKKKERNREKRKGREKRMGRIKGQDDPHSDLNDSLIHSRFVGA